MMNRLGLGARRAVAAIFIAAGAYYAFVGVWVLLNIVEVTQRWTRLSGDPEFPSDAGRFGIVIGIGAVTWLVLGVGTLRCGHRAFFGRPVARGTVISLAGTAVLIHIPWLLYRHIATVTLPRPEATEQFQAALGQFGALAVLYFVGGALLWRWPARRTAV